MPGFARLHGQVLEKPEERSQLLQSMENVLTAVDEESTSFDGISSPFVLGGGVDPQSETGVEEADAPEPLPDEEAVPEPTRLSDAVALRMVARRFRPLGSLVIGDKGVLQMDGGRNLAEGESFQARIHGVPYRVYIADVGRNGYVLRLRGETMELDFLSPGVQRNQEAVPDPRNALPEPQQ